MRKSHEELLEGRQIRRMKQEDKYLTKMEKLVDEADKMIGELVRNGKTVYYIFPVGGKYREGVHFDLVDFLIRNKYVYVRG